METTLLSNKDIVEIMRRIILKLYEVENDMPVRNDLYFMDDELADLLNQLKEH